jgi:hypothetical protein
MTPEERTVYARRAIESLRSGVPNSTAVESLGINEPVILEAFAARLEALTRDDREPVPGFFIEGDFGTGKSHILRYFESLSIKRRLATSSITISKETPLGDISSLFRTAMLNLIYPDGRLGGSLAEVFEQIDTNAPAYVRFFCEVCDEAGDLDPLFHASVLLYDRYRGDPAIVEQLVDFWDGGPPQVTIWKKLLKDVDAAPRISATSARQLAVQRFRFVSLALKAAGFGGWLVTIDEIELIAKFALRARTNAYATVNRLFSIAGEDAPNVNMPNRLAHTIIVGAITSDLLGELLNSRNERELLPQQFRLPAELIDEAMRGLDKLASEQSRFAIRPLKETDLERSYENIRNLYLTAYATDLPNPDVLGEYQSVTAKRNMRQSVRGWIAYWDLRRIDPTYEPHIVMEHLAYDLSEDQDLEEAGEDTSYESAI